MLQIPNDSSDLLPHAAASDSTTSVVTIPDSSGLLHAWALEQGEPVHALTSPPPWLTLLGPGPSVALAQAFCKRTQGTHRGTAVVITHDCTLWHGQLAWSPQQSSGSSPGMLSEPAPTATTSALAARISWQPPVSLTQLGLRSITSASMVQDSSATTILVTVAGRAGAQGGSFATVATVKIASMGSGQVLSTHGVGRVTIPGSASACCDLSAPLVMASASESGATAPTTRPPELVVGTAGYQGAPSCSDVLACHCSTLAAHARQHGRLCRRAAGAQEQRGGERDDIDCRE